jgi:predicted negative regulator of RcsB-dependent stress response
VEQALGKTLMDWFTRNSAAIQAIASIAGVIITAALVGVTYWYVRVTRTIANSSLAQVQEIQKATRASRDRNARALADLAVRIRNGLARLDADLPRADQIRAFTQVNESDITRLEVFASQVDYAPVLASESTAVVAIREILGTVEHCQKTPSRRWLGLAARAH